MDLPDGFETILNSDGKVSHSILARRVWQTVSVVGDD